MRKVPPGCWVLLAVLLAGCRSGPQRAPAIAEAYAGPAQLKIRRDIPLESPLVAVVKHGERVEIVQRRRRFMKVRTAGGAEGWTEERLLLNAEDLRDLQELGETARRLPSQGKATTYGDLNVHMQPSRQSPSFLLLKEGEKMDVLTHRAAPRTDNPRRPLIPRPPKKAPEKKEKRVKEVKYPPPALPKPPAPPSDWLELSKSALPEEEPEPPEEKAPTPVDDWTLVRTSGGQVGWVLTRRLVMAIPDEVAQYAEGRRITSYFSLGTVQDGEHARHNWLWTTIGGGPQPYDFDSFRVFIWSLRRHRYETAYIDRNIRGYAPVLLEQVQYGGTGKGATDPASYPGFSVCVEKSDGQRYRRSYAFIVNIVRFAGERPCEVQPAAEGSGAQQSVAAAPPPAGSPAETLADRFKRRLKAITRGWFGS